MMQKTTLVLLTVLVFGIVISSEQEYQEITEKRVAIIKRLHQAGDGHKYSVISLQSENAAPTVSFAEYQKIKEEAKETQKLTMLDGRQYYLTPFKEEEDDEIYDVLVSLDYQQCLEKIAKVFTKNFQDKSEWPRQEVCEELKKEIREKLRFVGGVNYMINQVSILSMDDKSDFTYSIHFVPFSSKNDIFNYRFPHCIFVNTQNFLKLNAVDKKLALLILAGTFKIVCANITDNELKEITVDVCVLDAFARRKNCRDCDLLCNFYLNQAKRELSREELIYHKERIFDYYEENNGNKFDPLIYARKIIADRRKPGYEQRVTARVERLLNMHRHGSDDRDSESEA